MPNWKEEFKKCNDNKLCISEVDAKARGNWFFQMDVIAGKDASAGGQKVIGSFEVYAFAPTLTQLTLDDQTTINERAASIYTALNMIHHSEAMAFLKSAGSFSNEIMTAHRSHRAFDQFKFILKRFTSAGGVLYKFGLDLRSVFILEFNKSGAGEKVLITHSKTILSAEYPGETEAEELRRAIKNR